MSTATSGREREYKVRDLLISKGYVAVMRAAASKGAADLLMGHDFIGAVLVQVGTGNKRLGPDDRARFLEAARLTCALPVVAQVIQRPGKSSRVEFWVVSEDVPSKWERWEP